MAQIQFRVLRPERMSEAVVHQLLGAVANGSIRAGEPFPTESELVDRFGVSRSVIRDALQVLAEKGIVSIQQGRRSVALARDQWDLLDPAVLSVELDGPGGHLLFEEIIRVRLALECEMAEEAARKITDEQLAALDNYLKQMDERLHAPDEFVESDIAFHELITSASGNRIARAIMRSLQEPLRLARRITQQVPGGPSRAQAHHEMIFRALWSRDPEDARRTMHEHLVWTREAWRSSAPAP